MIAIMTNLKKLIASTLAFAFIASALTLSAGSAKASGEGRDIVLGLGAIIVDKMIEAEERKKAEEEGDYESDRHDRGDRDEGGQDEDYNEEDRGDDQY